jgi:hypothetical protein
MVLGITALGRGVHEAIPKLLLGRALPYVKLIETI